MTKIPNIVIAGTVKGGSTSLFRYLDRHPDVCCSKKKETCYFLPLRYGKNLEPIENYEHMFSHWNGQKYVLEATPGYFEGGGKIANSIKDVLGSEAKIVILLRDPLDRLVSFFNYKKAQLQLNSDMSIEDYLKACSTLPLSQRKLQVNDAFWGVDGGRYMNYLPDWFNVFGNKNVKIIFFDDLKNHPQQVMLDLCKWMDIEGGLYENQEYAVENKTIRYKNANLHAFAIAMNTKLESIMRRAPGIKAVIRAAYYKLNGERKRHKQNSLIKTQIGDIYAEHNETLSAYLKAQGYLHQPAWLSNTQTNHNIT